MIKSIDIIIFFFHILKEIKHNLEVTRNMLSTMRLEPTTRQRLQLLLQRQHIEEEELRLRHFMELEKFRERKCIKFNTYFVSLIKIH